LRSRPALSSDTRVVAPSEVHASLPYDTLIDAMRTMYRNSDLTPDPVEYEVGVRGTNEKARFRLNPAWQVGRHIGLRVETAFPADDDTERLAPQGVYLLLDGRTGTALSLADGRALGIRRAASCSALAASYLARQDCERLLVVGTGEMATHLVEAMTLARPICNVLIWGRDQSKAERMAQRLNRRRLKVGATADLEAAVRGAHIITCATRSTVPLIKGEWLPDGVHIDLVGSVSSEMREVDDDCISRARVFVDTLDGALTRGGDVIQAIAAGAIREDEVAGELRDLTRGSCPGRRYYDQITMFKSVGSALGDLAAAAQLNETLRN
jgi:ornithine cyclodeaminase